MKTSKAVFVTLAMTAMMVTILVCLILLKHFIIFGIIAAVFFAVGVFKTASTLLGWLCDSKDASLEPVVIAEEEEPADDVPPVVTATVDEIMREVNG